MTEQHLNLYPKFINPRLARIAYVNRPYFSENGRRMDLEYLQCFCLMNFELQRY